MRLKRHVPLLESTLKRRVCAVTLPSTQCIHHNRHYAQSSPAYPEQVAVLGGGIAGLASAYYIAKEFPKSKITVFEAGKETGGWIKSKKVEVNGGEVVLEYGPRTLRPTAGALPTLQLIRDLGLTSQVLSTGRDSAGASNRYIYYPDQLNCLPAGSESLTIGAIAQLYRTGILDGVWNLLFENWQPKRPAFVKDESVRNFMARRVDKRVADNLLSAVFHGIYAGDINQLSAKTLLTTLWRFEGMFGSVTTGLMQANSVPDSPTCLPYHPDEWAAHNNLTTAISDNPEAVEFRRMLSKQSTFYFKNGMQTLPLALEASLRENEQVEFLTESPVKDFRKVSGESRIEVLAGKEESPTPRPFDFVVSTLPTKGLTPSVTVMVVNLWFKDPTLVPVKGFGYLIPQSVPFEENPERALGVIFDHDAIQGQDSVPGTKLTIMLGGHWWDTWTEYPDNAEGAELAKSVIQRHLGITAEPDIVNVTLNKDCIPQYTVGYEDRCIALNDTLRHKYNGRFRVVGSQYNGVGVNDCIKGAWELVQNMKGTQWKDKRTAGLEKHADTDGFILKPDLGIIRSGPNWKKYW